MISIVGKRWKGTGLSKEELYELYWTDCKSMSDIAKIVGCSPNTVSVDMRAKGVRARLPDGRNDGNFTRCHSIKNKDYLYWKYDILKSSGLVKNTPSTYWGSDQTGKQFLMVRFYTTSHPALKEYDRLLYKGNKLTVSRDILDMLKPLGLSVWFGDDGSVDYPYAAYLFTESFSIEENNLIKGWLKDRWQLEFDVKFKTAQNNLPFLYTSGRRQVDKLIETISPLPPSRNLGLERR